MLRTSPNHHQKDEEICRIPRHKNNKLIRDYVPRPSYQNDDHTKFLVLFFTTVNAIYCGKTLLRHALYDDVFQRMKSPPFVPVDDIGYAWEVLKPTIPSDMDDYTQYYESTWIGTPNSHAKFDPACWNQHYSALAGLPRSSNIAEGWHPWGSNPWYNVPILLF